MITISRTYYSDCTLGRLFIVGFSCHTLELPYLGNEPNKSCIEPGVYDYRVAYSDRWQRDVIWIDGVEGRTAIQGHPANKVEDLLGCFAVGDSVVSMTNSKSPCVANSRATFDRLLKLIPRTGKIQFTSAAKPYGVYR